MIGGFGMVALPGEYGVYEEDLGPGTTLRARQMTQFNPGKSWRPVVLE
jgi:hypothetical protein